MRSYLPSLFSSNQKIQVFNPPPSGIKRTAGAANIDVSSIASIIFEEDVTIYFDNYTTATITWLAGQPLGTTLLTSVHVDAAVTYVVM